MAEEDNNELDQKELEKERNKANNTKNIRNATDVAIASGHPVASGIGLGVKALDKATGGKASDALGEGLTTATKIVPGGNKFQRLSNKLSESGVSDAAGTVASIKNKSNSNHNEKSSPSNKMKDNKENNNLEKNDDNQSFPNNKSKKNNPFSILPNEDNSGNDEDSRPEAIGKIEGFFKKKALKLVLLPFLPIIFFAFIFLILFGYMGNILYNFVDLLGISITSGDNLDDINFNIDDIEDEDLKQFYNRVNNIYNQFILDNVMVCKPLYVVAVFHIFSQENSNIDYSSLNNNQIKEVFLASVDNRFNLFDEDIFKKNLLEIIIPKYFPNLNDDERRAILDQIFEYINDYFDLIGKDEEEVALCNTGIDTCSYNNSKGIYISKIGNISEKINMSNIEVQLMSCNNNKEKLKEEKPIPFEKYILGTTYEFMDVNDSLEAVKAYSIVVRDYALGISKKSNKWTLQKSKDNKYILKISSCISDNTPIYCDPDKGCSTNGEQVYSGSVFATEKVALPDNSKFRNAVEEVVGKTLINKDGYIIFSEISNNLRKEFTTLSRKGLTYEEILLKYYSSDNAYDIKSSSCSSIIETTNCIATEEYSKWKQTDPAWKDTPIGRSGKTLGQIGCLVTSVSMQIAKSKVKTTISDFSPKTFVLYLNNNGGFDNRGNYQWNAATKVAPQFKYMGQISLLGMSQNDKLNTIRDLISNKGVYAVAEVMGGLGQHWVAIDSVVGNVVNIMDPGSKSGNKNLWSAYNWENTSTLAYYKVG